MSSFVDWDVLVDSSVRRFGHYIICHDTNFKIAFSFFFSDMMMLP
jgi:hypothetical protein